MPPSFAYVTAEREVALADWLTDNSVEVRTVLPRDAPALIGEDGSKPVALTAPTWSTDGSQLAVSLLYQVTPLQPGASLAVLDMETSAASLVFQGTPGLAALIAPGLPHYVNWSPDGRHLALLAQTPSGMTLFIVDLQGLKPPTPVVSGAPLFFAWSPAGDALIVHRATDVLLVEASALESPSILMRGGLACQVPAWSASGDALAIARHASGGITISILSRAGDETEVARLAAVGAAVAWRPGFPQVAYSPRISDERRPGKGLWLTDEEGRRPALLTDQPVDAFYWSADGSMLATLSTARDSGLCAWSTIEIDTGIIRRLSPFYQSSDFALMLTFGEQYGISHRLWSAGRKSLLTTGRVPSNGTPPETTGSCIYVQPVEPGAHPIFAARGTFASWSPA